MPEKRWDNREIARSALNEMPPRDRVPFLAEMLCEVEGQEALKLLAGARNALSLHMTGLIDEQMGRDDGKAAGFFDIKEARRAVSSNRPRPTIERVEIGWRDVPRICLPGYLIHQAIEGIAGPLRRAGPSICQRLERLIERLDDTQAPAWSEALLRSIALWLTQSPNSARRAIPEEISDGLSSSPRRGPSTGSETGSPQSSGRV